MRSTFLPKEPPAEISGYGPVHVVYLNPTLKAGHVNNLRFPISPNNFIASTPAGQAMAGLVFSLYLLPVSR